MKNYWVIGDLHGEIGLLDHLLKHILKFDPEVLVFVGDYIDRGPHSREVIERLIELGDRAVCLLGNHEMMMLNAVESMGIGHSPVEQWYYNGGEATIMSFGFSSFFTFQAGLDDTYLDFFKQLKISHLIHPAGGKKILATHAGISPFIPLPDQLRLENYEDLRSCLQEKHLLAEDSFLWVREAFFDASPDIWDGYVVIHGHTPVNKLERYARARGDRKFLFVDRDISLRKETQNGSIVSIDIDSGSVISGRLSGIGFFEEEDPAGKPLVHMRSLTVSAEEVFPRDLGYMN